MKVLSTNKRWWVGLRAACEKCGAIVEFDGEEADELLLMRSPQYHPIGYSWECVNCGSPDNLVTVEWLEAWQPMLARALDTESGR